MPNSAHLLTNGELRADPPPVNPGSFTLVELTHTHPCLLTALHDMHHQAVALYGQDRRIKAQTTINRMLRLYVDTVHILADVSRFDHKVAR